MEPHADRLETGLPGGGIDRGLQIIPGAQDDGPDEGVVLVQKAGKQAPDAGLVRRPQPVEGAARRIGRRRVQPQGLAENLVIDPLGGRRQGIAKPFPLFLDLDWRRGPSQQQLQRRAGLAPAAAGTADSRVSPAISRMEAEK